MAVFSSLRSAFLVASTILSLSQPAVSMPVISEQAIAHLESLRMSNLTGNVFDKRANQYIDFAGVQSGFGPAKGQVPMRQDFNVFAQDGIKLNLYILALQRMQQQPQSVSTSFYGTAGIHGRPYKAWDNVMTGNNNGGYCTHADILFPSWHRPYMALYEQILWDFVQQIANEFPASNANKQKYMAAVATWRMPYWDWAVDASVAPLIGQYTQLNVEVPNKGIQTINNPLYSYSFNPLDPNDLPDEPFNQMQQTTRYPAWNGNGYISQPALMNQQLVNIGANMKSRVYNLMTAYTDFRSFADKATSSAVNGNFDSLEGVHDTIHSVVGGNGGHMSIVDYAAFDPIFFLHHTNIDRLFAIWQAINPSTYVTPYQNQYGTFGIPAGTVEDVNTGLSPFHQSDQAFWTSTTVASTKTFGYTYPELQDWAVSSTQFRSSVITQVNKLYGQFSASNLFTSAGARKRQATTSAVEPTETGTVLGGQPPVASASPVPGSVDATPSQDAVDAHIGQLVQGNSYNEWLAEMSVDNNALNGTFNILIFLGEFNADPSQWAVDPNLVGTHSVFTMVGGGHASSVSGSVPLTNALINRVIAGQVDNLTPDAIVPFLKTQLHWRVQAIDQTTVDPSQVDSLAIQVSSSNVELPSHSGELPVWGPMTVQYEVTDGRPGGVNNGSPN